MSATVIRLADRITLLQQLTKKPAVVVKWGRGGRPRWRSCAAFSGRPHIMHPSFMVVRPAEYDPRRDQNPAAS